jgi:hypothetical protein
VTVFKAATGAIPIVAFMLDPLQAQPGHWHCRLLRPRREWPRGCRAGRRTAEQRDELAPSHA